MIFIKIYKWFKNRERKQLLALYGDISKKTIDCGINIRVDIPVKKKLLYIKEGGIIAGNYVFESGKGQISIGRDCYIGNSTFISHSQIIIGNHVTIAWGATIYDHNSHSLNYQDRRKDIEVEYHDICSEQNFIAHKDWSDVKTAPITIEDDVWIGMNCIILKGVTIGQGAIIGAGSVVTHDVPAWSVVAGNPARVVKYLKKDKENEQAIKSGIIT
jgi:galactoside O-acetyltransferase